MKNKLKSLAKVFVLVLALVGLVNVIQWSMGLNEQDSPIREQDFAWRSIARIAAQEVVKHCTEAGCSAYRQDGSRTCSLAGYMYPGEKNNDNFFKGGQECEYYMEVTQAFIAGATHTPYYGYEKYIDTAEEKFRSWYNWREAKINGAVRVNVQ